jgi:hypothetical protein
MCPLGIEKTIRKIYHQGKGFTGQGSYVEMKNLEN